MRDALADGLAQDEERGDHEDNADDEANNPILHEAGDDEAHERDDRHREHVGQLRLHVDYVVHVRAGRGHDRRIRNGRAVIAADRTSQAGGDADGEQLGLGRENRHDDRDEDAESTPARARGKRETKRNEKDNRRQHAIQAGGGAFHQPGDEDIGAERGRRELEGEREGENEHRRS